jgi:hypothetical protein
MKKLHSLKRAAGRILCKLGIHKKRIDHHEFSPWKYLVCSRCGKIFYCRIHPPEHCDCLCFIEELTPKRLRIKNQEKIMESNEVNLGDVVKDKITGFQGMVIAITHWLNGCIRINVQPQALKDGKPIESECFDIQQIEVVKAKASPVTKRPGGPFPKPSRQKDPSLM